MKYTILILLLVSYLSSANAKVPHLQISELTENIYLYTSYQHVEPWGMVGANGLIIIDGSDAHLIDTPWTVSGTKALIKWIESKDLAIKSGVVTHFHEDASGGIPLLNRLRIKTYATSLTNQLLQSNNREQASNTITNNTFKVVKNTIEAFYPGAGHTQDNIVIWLPKSNLLFGGCFVKSARSQSLGNTADAEIKTWPASIQKVIDKYPNMEVVVPGHGQAGGLNLLTHTAKLAISEKGL